MKCFLPWWDILLIMLNVKEMSHFVFVHMVSSSAGFCCQVWMSQRVTPHLSPLCLLLARRSTNLWAVSRTQLSDKLQRMETSTFTPRKSRGLLFVHKRAVGAWKSLWTVAAVAVVKGSRRDSGGCSVFTLFITELSMFAMIRSGILLNSLFFLLGMWKLYDVN